MALELKLSHTQISMYLKCPRQYAYRYVEGLKTPPSGVKKRSGVGHRVIADNYAQKAVSKTDLPVDEIEDRYAAWWKEEMEREETVFDEDGTPEHMRDTGIRAVREHRLSISPRVQPASADAVEEWFDLPLRLKSDDDSEAMRYALIGRIDLTDAAGIIRDAKIVGARRNITADDVARDAQLSIYAIAHRIKTGQSETGVALDTVKMLKGGPKAQVLPGVRTREFLLDQLNTIGHVARGIDAHVFPRRTDGWWCSRKWCGYWDLCVGKNLKIVGPTNGGNDGKQR